jgi:hypothetical protein
MRLTPSRLCLKNLKREIPAYMRREHMSSEKALELLRAMTGQDFGSNVQRWEEWIRAQEVAGVVFHFPKNK